MISEDHSTCIKCGKAFPYRKSKQFCSNACKQQAYLCNKAGVSLSVVTNKEKPAYDFSFSEYRAYEKETDNGIDLLFFCFLRRHLKGNVDLSQLMSYFDGFFHDDFSWWDYYESVRDTKAYLSFREDFLSSKFTVGV